MPDSIFEQEVLPGYERVASRRRTKIAWWTCVTALMAFVLLALGAALYILVLVRETQLINYSTNQTIKDCTETTGKCFQESQRRLAETVGGINDYARYAAACADQAGVQGEEEIEVCIRRAVRDDQRDR